MPKTKPFLFTGNGLSLGGFALAFAVFSLVLYGGVVLGFQTFYYRDFGLFGYPLAYHHRLSFWNGEVPLWNPYSGCGMPFLAQWNTLVLYPGSLIYLFLPLPWGVNLFMVLHLFWAAIAMYWLAWRWTGDRLGATVAGIAYGLGGLLMNSLMWPNNIAAFSWMPWVVLAVETASRRGGRWMLHAAILGTVQMLTGAPEIILLTWVVALAASLCTTGCKGWRWMLFGGGRLALVVGLIVALSAAQLVPFLELLLVHSQRTGQFERGDWEIAWTGWANFILPLFKTVHSPGGIAAHPNQFWTNSYYSGIGTVFLSLCAVFYCGDRRRIWLLLGLAVTGFWLALGEKGGILPWLEKGLLPLRLVRFQVKYIVLTGFALPLMAAFGVRWWFAASTSAAEIGRAIRLWCGLLSLTAACLVGIAVFAPGPSENWLATVHNGWSRLALLGGIVGCLYWMRSCLNRGAQMALVGAVVLLSATDQWTHEPNQNPTTAPWVMAPIHASLGAMDPMPTLGQGRAMTATDAGKKVFYREISDTKNYFLVTRMTLLGNANLLDRIPVVQGFFSLYPRESHFLRRLVQSSTNFASSAVYDLLGASQVTAPGTEFEWSYRSSALPMLTLGGKCRFLTLEETLAYFEQPHYDPRQVLCLPRAYAGRLRLDEDVRGQVLEQRVSDQRVEAQVEVDGPALLRVGQSFYPHWRGFLDGRPVPVMRCDFAFQAVELPKGRHQVALRYFNPYFAWGLATGWIALVAAGVLITSSKRPARG